MFNKKFDSFVDWFAHLKREIRKSKPHIPVKPYEKERFEVNLETYIDKIRQNFKYFQQGLIEEDNFCELLYHIVIKIYRDLNINCKNTKKILNPICDSVDKIKVVSKENLYPEMIIQNKDRNLEEWFEIVKKIIRYHYEKLEMGGNLEEYLAEIDLFKKECIREKKTLFSDYQDIISTISSRIYHLSKNKLFEYHFKKDLKRIIPKNVNPGGREGVEKFMAFYKGLIGHVLKLKGTDFFEGQDEKIDQIVEEIKKKQLDYEFMFKFSKFDGLKIIILNKIKEYADNEYFVADIEIYLNKALKK
jgi:hypothetical protein